MLKVDLVRLIKVQLTDGKKLETRTEIGYLNPHLHKPFCLSAQVFMYLQRKSLENTVGKGEIARNEQFLLFSQRFLPFWITSHNFYLIKNCCLQSL